MKTTITQKFLLATAMFFSEATGSAEEPLKVATYNVFNLDPRDEKQADRLGDIVVGPLKKPHIIGVQEVQDDDGPKNTNITSSDETLKMLIREIVKDGGPEYKFVYIAPEDDKDGGEPGGNIRNAYLYDSARVRLVEAPGGAGGLQRPGQSG